VASNKVQTHMTGGGQFIPQITDLDEKVLQFLGHRAMPLCNPYDTDSAYNNETGLLSSSVN